MMARDAKSAGAVLCEIEAKLEAWMAEDRGAREISMRLGRGGGWVVELRDGAFDPCRYFQGMGHALHEAAHRALREHAQGFVRT